MEMVRVDRNTMHAPVQIRPRSDGADRHKRHRTRASEAMLDTGARLESAGVDCNASGPRTDAVKHVTDRLDGRALLYGPDPTDALLLETEWADAMVALYRRVTGRCDADGSRCDGPGRHCDAAKGDGHSEQEGMYRA